MKLGAHRPDGSICESNVMSTSAIAARARVIQGWWMWLECGSPNRRMLEATSASGEKAKVVFPSVSASILKRTTVRG
jgi:hypothetical protein